MESTDKLREWARRVTESNPDENIVSPEFVAQECGRKALLLADEIEQEIAEKYIALPLDSEGIPIHPGDTLGYCSEDIIDVRGENLGNVEGCEEVLFIAFDGDGECITLESEGWHDLSFFSDYSDMNFVHAAKPRTIEDVLRDCCNEWNKHCGDDWESGVIAKYADKLRNMAVGE